IQRFTEKKGGESQYRDHAGLCSLMSNPCFKCTARQKTRGIGKEIRRAVQSCVLRHKAAHGPGGAQQAKDRLSGQGTGCALRKRVDFSSRRFENYQNLQVPRFLAKRFKRLERSACPEQRRRKAIEIPLMVSWSNHWNDWNGPVTVRTIHEHVLPPYPLSFCPHPLRVTITLHEH